MTRSSTRTQAACLKSVEAESVQECQKATDNETYAVVLRLAAKLLASRAAQLRYRALYFNGGDPNAGSQTLIAAARCIALAHEYEEGKVA